MTYQKTLEYLFSRLPIFQREGNVAYKKDLNNIITAVKKIGNPQNKFKSIHIAGTNGKGSVSHMISSILQECGYKVGLYTSPHMKDFRERIKVNGQMIYKSEVIQFVSENKLEFERINLSFFEFTLALAFHYFAKKKIDIAVIETGLGGRIDSTNIINPELSIITNIGIDHTNLLGNTLEKIAKEKAGIIKKNIPVIIGRYQSRIHRILENTSKKKETTIKYATNHNFETDLNGAYQIENINTAVTAVTAIKKMQKINWVISELNIRKGLLNTVKNTGILGRWQILNKKPLTICDVGHNEDGIKEIFKQIKLIKHNNLHVVFGVVIEKDLSSILDLLPKNATYYFCKPNIVRGLDRFILKKEANTKRLKGNSYASVQKALEEAKKYSKNDDLIFIGGSTFVVAEII